MKNKQTLLALASDLKRIAIGLQRKSYRMADRFMKEALVRKQETELTTLPPYMQKILAELDPLFQSKDNDRKAEDALMYSTLIQNFATYTPGVM